MAQGLASRSFPGCEVSSAGLMAFASPASPNAVEALARRGLDIGAHVSRMVTQQMLIDADIVLALADDHKDALARNYPDMGEKIFTLGEFAGEDVSVEDPFGGDLEVYIECADTIASLIEKSAKRIRSDGGE
jgi:protein-tyrosine-phosphatase